MQLVAVNAARRPAALPLGDNIHGTNITSKTPGITPERNMQDVACTNCRTRKVRCGRERPQCESCIRDGAECVYSTPTKRVNHVKVLYVSPERPNERIRQELTCVCVSDAKALTRSRPG